MSCFKKLKDRDLGDKSVLQWQLSHALHVLLFGKESADGRKAEGAEEQQQRPDSEPLDAIYGLKQVFVHEVIENLKLRMEKEKLSMEN